MLAIIHKPGDLPSLLSPIRRARRPTGRSSPFAVAQAVAMRWGAGMKKNPQFCWSVHQSVGETVPFDVFTDACLTPFER